MSSGRKDTRKMKTEERTELTLYGTLVTFSKKTEEKEESASHEVLVSFSKGLLFSLISGAALSSTSGIIKYMPNIHPWQFVLYCFCECLAFSLPWAIWSRENLLGPRNLRTSILARSIFATVSTVLQFIVFRYLLLVEVVVLVGSTPVFVTLAARIFLREALNALILISLLTTIAGITLITGLYQVIIEGSRKYTAEDVYGLSAALGSVLCSTAQTIITRKLRHVDQSVLVLNTCVVSVVGLSIFTACVSGFPSHYRGLQQILIIGGGLLAFASMAGAVASLKYMEAGPASTIRIASSAIVAFLVQVLVFRDVTDTIEIIGVVLVGSSIILLGLRKHLNSFFSETSCFVKQC